MFDRKQLYVCSINNIYGITLYNTNIVSASVREKNRHGQMGKLLGFLYSLGSVINLFVNVKMLSLWSLVQDDQPPSGSTSLVTVPCRIGDMSCFG